MKITSEDFTKLVGPYGERFTSEAELRLTTCGDWFISDCGSLMFSGSGAGTFGHRIVLTRANPPAKQKTVKRLEVVTDSGGFMYGGNRPLYKCASRADFRGFVFVLPDGQELTGLAATLIWWGKEVSDRNEITTEWSLKRTDFCTIPLRPSFVEVDQ